VRVLVVEDEEAVGDLFLDYLLELGHQPFLVRSAEAALSRLNTERPDAILLDVHLPGMSGVDFLQLRPIRESGVPIVAVSGVATENQARECLRLGALDFMGKPIRLERLGEVLEYLEPHALDRRLAVTEARVERRRSLRVPIRIPVLVAEYSGGEWYGTSMTLSPHGIKIKPREPVRPGGAAKLTFTLPDGREPLEVMSLLVRQDRDGHAFFFVNLTSIEFQRISDLVKKVGGADPQL
jgi:CheY-like chemotaxis protein